MPHSTKASAAYFNWVEIDENVLWSVVPSPFTAATIPMEMPPAIRAYSIAVAPVSSFRKALIVACIAKQNKRAAV